VRALTSTRIIHLVTIALALTASACGGGGGGSTPNVPGPTNTPGGPPPNTSSPSPGASITPSPSPTHSNAPTPTPSPVHTNSPTPMPTSTTTTGTTILPDTTGRFGLIQILDDYGRNNAQLTTSQIQSEAPNYDSVWGTFFPSTWSAAHPGMILSRYYMPFEDNSLVSGNNLNYFLTNHPDWILYGCDNNNNPTADYAFSGTGFPNDVPLDIHNPAVVQYQMQTILAYLAANGYNALAVDNVVFENFLTSPNPRLEPGKTTNPGWYGCGIYTSGPANPSSFVRRYNGPLDNLNDANFNADVNNWIAQARATLGPHGIKVLVNHPPHSSAPSSDELTMLSHIDGMVDENGYTHYGTLLNTNAFANTLNWVEYLQGHNIAALITDYFCTGSSCSNDPSTLTAQQADWALASYAIGNNGGENVYISPHGGAIYSYRSEYSRRYGAACGSYTPVSSFVYERRFQGGLAIVNATSGTPYSLALPAGHNYSDIEGRPVTNPLIVNPTDAYMLLTSGNGCS